jgi:hypothetical protein
MAILEQQTTEISGGFNKEIESGAMSLMMDILQKYQYQFPVKSSIRELASNGLDSISEREVAKKILSGQNQVSDFFEEREGDLYKDSKFDPDYYDLKYLSTDPNIYITYHVGSGVEKDKVTIKDNGVGLGKYRLEKYFNLGYSSKRLSKLPLGKFGLGNKSPLSINDYYTVESRYNGYLFRFNIYSGKVESLIPKFDLATGNQNIAFTMSNGVELYALKTEEKNGVTVTIEAKKHHKAEYEDAVKSQLAYFPNIKFAIETDGKLHNVPFQANILYEDDYILLSDSTYFSKPHILLNKVNYGFVDFQELELEQKRGNIALKVLPEDVTVSPSRESLIWDDNTKKMVVQRFKDTVKSATTLIEKELSTEVDFLRWMIKCIQAGSRHTNQDTVLGRLSNLINMEDISPQFKGMEFQKPFQLIRYRRVFREALKKANKVGTKIVRDDKPGLAFVASLPVVLKDSPTSGRKDKYLLSLYPAGFITVDKPFWLVNTEIENHKLGELYLYSDQKHTWTEEIYSKEKAKGEQVWKFLNESTDVLKYEEIEVPKDFTGSDEDEDLKEIEELTEEESKIAALSREERRKLEGKVIVNTPRTKSSLVGDYARNPDGSYAKNSDDRPFRLMHSRLYEWQKLEVPAKEIGEWDEEEIYYGNEADIKTLEFVALLTRDGRQEELTYPRSAAATDNYSYRKQDEETFEKVYQINCNEAYKCTHFFDTKVKIIKVAQQSNKLYKDFKHINKFFAYKSGKTLTMSNTLIKWNTARLIRQRLNEVAFLFNFPFNQAKEDSFKKLRDYVKLNYKSMDDLGKISDENSLAYTTMVAHLDKVYQFQAFVKTSQDPQEIAKLAKELWKSDTIEDGCAVDMELIEEMNSLLDWGSSIKGLLNHIPELTGSTAIPIPKELNAYNSLTQYPISDELHLSIASYLESKGVSS